MRKGSVLLDKLIAVGFAILEKSKAIMYEHYFRLKNILVIAWSLYIWILIALNYK